MRFSYPTSTVVFILTLVVVTFFAGAAWVARAAEAQETTLACSFRYPTASGNRGKRDAQFTARLNEPQATVVIDDTPPRRMQVGPDTFRFSFGDMTATINRITGNLTIAAPRSEHSMVGSCTKAAARRF
jgi:hypothetical protein